MMPNLTHYEVLGVHPDASLAEIKLAFRRLARSAHPDLCPEDSEAEETFKAASVAYEVLCDAETRWVYDLQLGAGVRHATSNRPDCREERSSPSPDRPRPATPGAASWFTVATIVSATTLVGLWTLRSRA